MFFKRKATAIFLAIAMVFSFMPAAAFADDITDVDQAAEVQTQDVQAADEAAALQAELLQTQLNFRNVTVRVEDLEAIIAENAADSVKISASMSYNGKVTEKTEKTIKLADFDVSSKSAEFELPYYGKYDTVVSFMKGGKQVGESIKGVLGVAAEEYNIALLAATTDALIFSLKYNIDGSIKQTTEAGEPVPTIVTLNRPKQIDWDCLPEGMFRDPLFSKEENLSVMKWDNLHGPDNRVNRVVQYVKELNEINPGSKFNFFINDYHIYSFPRLSYANGLEDDQYTLTLLTDGSATYVWFKNAYEGTNDAQAVHDRLVSEYMDYKGEAKAGKITDYEKQFPSGTSRIYAYAIVCAEDAQWWVVRRSTDTFGLTDQAFQAKVLADPRISNNYINSLLNSIQEGGKEEYFKKLYKFDDTDFNATRAKGKKIIMILGTSKHHEDTYPATDYARFMIAEMGDEYEFYYKGHPGNYTADSPANVAKYKAMGIQMLDPSIAAELFLFYNDDIYLCGYESTLFTNASSDKSEEQDVALFRRTLQTAKSDSGLAAYVDCMDFFISDMTDDKDIYTYAYDEEWDAARPGMTEAKAESRALRDKVLALVPAAEKGCRNYLVQYNNNEKKTVSQYDYAIWNSDKSIIHYIKTQTDGSLKIVATKDLNDPKVGQTVKVSGNSYKVTSVKDKKVQFTKAKNSKSVSVPKTVTINGKKYKVTNIGAKAFTGKKIRTVTVGANVKKLTKYALKGSKATKLVLKTKLLSKSRVKGSLKSSKIKKVKVSVGSKKTNRKYVKKYRKYFTKKNAGKAAKVY